MSTLLNFEFLAILNLFILLLWPSSAPYINDRRGALGMIILIVTIVVVFGDIVFLVLKMTGH
jgi:hypothetical protein